MVFSAYQLIKEPRVLTDRQRNREMSVKSRLFVCLSNCVCVCVCVCVGVEAKAWHLSGWRAYENIGPRHGTNLYLSNVSNGG